jgi:DNA-binding transcriptional ArsR family regulator
MTIKLQLVRDDRIICEVPLSMGDWRRRDLEDEIDEMRRGLQGFSRVMDALGNANRVRMVAHLFEDEDFTLSFKDFIEELGLNPKLVREHTSRLREAGFLDMPERGKYRLSPIGRIRFLAAGPAMMRILRELGDQLDINEESGSTQE